MKCISLWNPWAVLWANGQKRIETRGWAYRGPLPCVLAVHASKQWGPGLATLCLKPPYRDALESCGVRLAADPAACKAGWNLPFGAVVGLVRVAWCKRTSIVRMDAPDAEPFARTGAETLHLAQKEYAFGDFTPGRFGWVCDHFRPLPAPVPLRGMQGVFDWDAPAEVEALRGG